VSEQLPPPSGVPVESAASQGKTPKIILWAFIVSLFGILFLPAIAAIVMVAIGWKQISASGKGKGFAFAAVLISVFWVGILLIAGATSNDDPAENAVTGTEEVVEEPVEDPADSGDSSGLVSRAMFGDDWPFAVDEGTVRCEVIKIGGIDDRPAAIITLNGDDYALNGVAITQGYTELTTESDIWLDNDFGGKKILRPITSEALALCGELATAPEATEESQDRSESISQAIGAWVMCQSRMNDFLKAPASAGYPLISELDYSSNGGTFIFPRAWVDAQNSFGAQIRTFFSCTATNTGGDSWTVSVTPLE
jgi:hypothetical protein